MVVVATVNTRYFGSSSGPHIGVEHVFLAMLAEGSSVPVQLLGRHLDLDAFREELSSFLESGYGNPGR